MEKNTRQQDLIIRQSQLKEAIRYCELLNKQPSLVDVIKITTNNATDEFVAGDVIYDLLRTLTYADTVKDYVTDYPLIDLVNLEITKKLLEKLVCPN